MLAAVFADDDARSDATGEAFPARLVGELADIDPYDRVEQTPKAGGLLPMQRGGRQRQRENQAAKPHH